MKRWRLRFKCWLMRSRVKGLAECFSKNYGDLRFHDGVADLLTGGMYSRDKAYLMDRAVEYVALYNSLYGKNPPPF